MKVNDRSQETELTERWFLNISLSGSIDTVYRSLWDGHRIMREQSWSNKQQNWISVRTISGWNFKGDYRIYETTQDIAACFIPYFAFEKQGLFCRDVAKQVIKNVDDDFEWDWEKTRELLVSYLAGDMFNAMASRLKTTEVTVVKRLTEIVLNTSGELINDSALHYGHLWTQSDHKKLERLWKLGRGVAEIAKELGRDQLGIAFVIFSRHTPIIPHGIIEDFKLAGPQ